MWVGVLLCIACLSFGAGFGLMLGFFDSVRVVMVSLVCFVGGALSLVFCGLLAFVYFWFVGLCGVIWFVLGLVFVLIYCFGILLVVLCWLHWCWIALVWCRRWLGCVGLALFSDVILIVLV